MTTKADFPFLFGFRVRYAEIDGQGVVFNAHYLTYFDVAITEYFRDMGFDYVAYPRETGCDFHLVKSLVNYEKPLLFDTEFEVGCRCAKLGNSSLTFELAIFDKASETRYATGEIVWVNTHQSTHKTHSVPDSIRKMITAYQA
ncbi:acyl-CoA thioesterase [Sneathiella glossodoripedis]|uniref:acyl-CoA thioesterase n=1 Tax=Sneathiella glossodoripedis TaxID=418853 RepID=UPI00046F7000|nr:thioesterase family protein [Sneathiella glossodoripedis]